MKNLETKNTSFVLQREELTGDDRNDMFDLLTRHFDGVKREQFEADLAEKNWIILLRNEARLTGFSTILAYESSFKGEPLSLICSGDTIVTPDAWGTTALSKSWISCVRSLRSSYHRGKYYWLLLTSGFRTYRFLPVFWRDFFPRFDSPSDLSKKKLLDHLALERFGSQYDSQEGIVRFLQPQKLRKDLLEIPSGRLSDPHIAFFLSKNPGFVNGDELVCLTELHDENLTSAGKRMIS